MSYWKILSTDHKITPTTSGGGWLQPVLVTTTGCLSYHYWLSHHCWLSTASPKPGVSTTVNLSFTPFSSMSTVVASMLTVCWIRSAPEFGEKQTTIHQKKIINVHEAFSQLTRELHASGLCFHIIIALVPQYIPRHLLSLVCAFHIMPCMNTYYKINF